MSSQNVKWMIYCILWRCTAISMGADVYFNDFQLAKWSKERQWSFQQMISLRVLVGSRSLRPHFAGNLLTKQMLWNVECAFSLEYWI